jgi:O-antigen ligase
VTDWLFLAFIGVNVISTIINRDFQNGFFGQYYRYQGLVTLACLGGVYFVSSLITNKAKKSMVAIIQWSGLIYSMVVYVQGILFFGLNLPIYNFNGRIAGFMGNPNFMAGFLALAFGFSKFRYLPLYLAAIIFTGSRSGLIGIGVVVILRLIFYAKIKAKLFLIIFVIAGIGLIVFKLENRAISSFDNRAIIWKQTIKAISTKPILGWGKENFAKAFESTLGNNDFDLKHIRVDKAHNEFLDVTIESGIIGLSIYLILVLRVFYILLINLQDPWIRQNLILLTVFFVMAFVNVVNINSYLFLYLSLGTGRQLEIKKSICRFGRS